MTTEIRAPPNAVPSAPPGCDLVRIMPPKPMETVCIHSTPMESVALVPSQDCIPFALVDIESLSRYLGILFT